ncbi:Rab3 GTPase-activating protein catalytic subunit-domain-containing protein [Chytriomyces sp. MP71]|nr:Rab3 GTPase-activating protein catalytic subunit-domain-containing protein [Chytriomyces sp. MP71]
METVGSDTEFGDRNRLQAERSETETEAETDPEEAEAEVFEIVDYSINGAFERLASAVEDALSTFSSAVASVSDTRGGDGLKTCHLTRGVKANVHSHSTADTSLPVSLRRLATFAGLSHSDRFLVVSHATNFVFDWDAERTVVGALSVALRATSVLMPVFVPIGSAWRSLFTGIMIASPTPLHPSIETCLFTPPPPLTNPSKPSNPALDTLLARYSLIPTTTTTRFRMFHSPFIPSDHAELVGLKHLFLDRLANGYTGNPSTPGVFNLHLHAIVQATGTYSYQIPFAGKGSGGYYYDPIFLLETSQADSPTASSIDARMHSQSTSKSTPRNSYDADGREGNALIPVGPALDPVAWLELDAWFRADVCEVHFRNRMAMDATSWTLVTNLRSEGLARHGRLYTTLSAVLDAWVISCSTLQQEFTDVTSDDATPNGPHTLSPHPDSMFQNIGMDQSHAHTNSALSMSKRLVKSSFKRLAAAATSTITDATHLTNPTTPTFSFPHQPLLPPHILHPPQRTTTNLRTLATLSKARVSHSAPADTTLWRLARHLLTSLLPYSPHSPESAAVIAREVWTAFTRALRDAWEYGEALEEHDVDLRDAILVQKVGMLGYCCQRRRGAGKGPRETAVVAGVEQVRVKRDPRGPRLYVDPGKEDGIITLGTMLLSVMGVDTGGNEDGEGSAPIAVKDGVAQQGQSQMDGSLGNSVNAAASFRYGASWNSDRSWEDFADMKRASVTATPQKASQYPASIEEDSETEYYDQNIAGGDLDNSNMGGVGNDCISGDADMFFDSLDFHDIPPKHTPKKPIARRTFDDASAASATTRANVSSGNVSAEAKYRAGSSVRSDDSSGIVVGSMSPKPYTMPAVADIYSPGLDGVNRSESFVKLPSLETSTVQGPTNPTADDDSYATVELRDPDACAGALYATDFTLLATGAPMMVPELQESGLMTEDMIAEQERVLLSLGTSRLRARMQTGQLLSDMESFKAANPHACLEDFVRWHSPRDWIVEEGVGKLSARMMDPGNLWMECWGAARRIPAAKQKPLFDHEKEGEKVLFFLEELGRSQELLYHLLPTLFYVAYDAIVSNPLSTQIPSISRQIPSFTSQLISMNWNSIADLDVALSEFCFTLNQLEYQIGLAQSLLYKLPMQMKLVDRLVSHLNAEDSDGSTIKCDLHAGVERKAVVDLLADEGVYLNIPSKREFILHTSVPYPTPSSRVLPQRMFALLKEGEFRIFESVAYDER